MLHLSRNGERKTHATLWPRYSTFPSCESGRVEKGPPSTREMKPGETEAYNHTPEPPDQPLARPPPNDTNKGGGCILARAQCSAGRGGRESAAPPGPGRAGRAGGAAGNGRRGPRSADLRHVGRAPRDPSQQRPAPGRRERGAPPPAGPASPARGAAPAASRPFPALARRAGPTPPRCGPVARGAGAAAGAEGRGGGRRSAAGRAQTKAPGRGLPRPASRPSAAMAGLRVLLPESPSRGSSLQAAPHLPVGGERASDPGPGSHALRRRRRRPPPPRAAPPPLPRADTDRTPWAAAAAAARERAPQRPPRLPPGRRRRRRRSARPRARRALPLNTTHCGGRHEEARPRAPAARGRGFPRARAGAQALARLARGGAARVVVGSRAPRGRRLRLSTSRPANAGASRSCPHPSFPGRSGACPPREDPGCVPPARFVRDQRGRWVGKATRAPRRRPSRRPARPACWSRPAPPRALPNSALSRRKRNPLPFWPPTGDPTLKEMWSKPLP